MMVFAGLGPVWSESGVAEMLVRRVRMVAIGRTTGGKNDNLTASLFLHVSYAERCISYHIAPVMSSHAASTQLLESTFSNIACSIVPARTVFLGINNSLTAQ